MCDRVSAYYGTQIPQSPARKSKFRTLGALCMVPDFTSTNNRLTCAMSTNAANQPSRGPLGYHNLHFWRRPQLDLLPHSACSGYPLSQLLFQLRRPHPPDILTYEKPASSGLTVCAFSAVLLPEFHLPPRGYQG